MQLSAALTLDLVDGLCKALDIARGDAGNRDSAVFGSVDAVLLCELVHLFGSEASVGEHANLAGDVGPVVLATQLFKVLLQQGAHGDDSVGHALDFTKPLLVQSGVVENGRCDTGAVDGRVGVERTNEDLDLRVDALLLVGIGADNGKGTDTLTVKTLMLSISMTDQEKILQEAIPCSWRKTGTAQGDVPP